MKKASFASLIALFLSVPAAAIAAVPQTIGFQARIADDGRPVTGSHSVRFAFWDCDGTNPATCVDPANVLWQETQTLTVADGVLTAVLGAEVPNPFPGGLFGGAPLFLQVTFDGTPLSPRMAVQSVPYALRAAVAESMAVPLNCTDVFATYTLAANGGRCPFPPFCFCIIGQYCPCDSCNSPACPAGHSLTGGGHWDGGFSENFSLLTSIPSGNSWRVRAINRDVASSLSLSVYARCCRVP